MLSFWITITSLNLISSMCSFMMGASGSLAGYAYARLFAEELLLYDKAGKADLIEGVLNRRDFTFMVNIKKYFKTFKSDVIEGKDASAVAREMLEKRLMKWLYSTGKSYISSI